MAALALPLTALRAQPAPRPLQLSDLSRLRVVADPKLSLDGAWVAYTVTRADSATNATPTWWGIGWRGWGAIGVLVTTGYCWRIGFGVKRLFSEAS